MSFPISLLAMIVIVVSSNYLVLFPINDWLTYGAFTYPISYLITELTTQFHGARKAKKIVYTGFALAILISFFLATPRIAIASSLAFLISQLLDIYLFTHIRQKSWWYAPLAASFFATAIDTMIFWGFAFAGENMPLMTLASGDFIVKLGIDLTMLIPFRLALRNGAPISAP